MELPEMMQAIERLRAEAQARRYAYSAELLEMVKGALRLEAASPEATPETPKPPSVH